MAAPVHSHTLFMILFGYSGLLLACWAAALNPGIADAYQEYNDNAMSVDNAEMDNPGEFPQHKASAVRNSGSLNQEASTGTKSVSRKNLNTGMRPRIELQAKYKKLTMRNVACHTTQLHCSCLGLQIDYQCYNQTGSLTTAKSPLLDSSPFPASANHPQMSLPHGSIKFTPPLQQCCAYIKNKFCKGYNQCACGIPES